ncbi:MAG: M48 family metalloprotease [Nitrospirae bacterium]|nr:M48 family metalloprotease [Nitrospirota bacterium]
MIKRLVLLLMAAGLAGCTFPAVPQKSEPPREPAVKVPNPTKEMGKEFLREALNHYQFVRDPEVTGMVNRVGRRIVEGLGANPSGYHFLVVRESQPNAFAIPGGYIFVFDGLLMQIGNEEELAGVLAHEIAHVERNHFFKDEKKVAALDIATIAAILLGGGSTASMVIAGAANVDVRLAFSRENESEADSYAIRYLKKAGYDPRGLPAFFKSLLRYERFNPRDIPAYASTHPDMESRFLRLEETLRNESVSRGGGPEADWGRITAILLAQERGIQEESALFQTLRLADLPAGEAGEERRRALLGLYHLRGNRATQAVSELQESARLNPNDPAYPSDLALAYLRLQNPEEARGAAERALRLDPHNPQAHLVLGILKENSGEPSEAVAHLREALRETPDDPAVNLHLSLAYGTMGDPLQAAFHSARYFRINLEPDKALREFKRAEGLAAGDPALQRRILQEMEELTREGI